MPDALRLLAPEMQIRLAWNAAGKTGEFIRDSKRLTAASRLLLWEAREHIETTRTLLDRTRNLLQVQMLMRALREAVADRQVGAL